MSICLGNLSIEDMERRSGVKFPQELIDYMKDKKQEKAQNIAPGKWHCFDLPFVLFCGGLDIATVIYGHLKPIAGDFKEPLQIIVSETKPGETQ